MDAELERFHPMDCIGCGKCEAFCPQMIKISEVMQDFSKRLKKE